ncbi:sigma-E factor negative regulatory protein [Hydrogenophaga sp. 5NK40-0174]|uniref:sigma-E factor negative regulatory protein n=1 Tax=Hydrogenophaga sp. 5NK40-0174 TaxID=3127649 RepID=UPI00310702AC
MNERAKLSNAQSNAQAAPLSGAIGAEATLELLSALTDGELDEKEARWLLSAGEPDENVHARWTSYHLIGDVLRGQSDLSVVSSPQSLLTAVRAQVGESSGHAFESPEAKPHGHTELAHSRTTTSANDATYRWKLLAAAASVAAVAAVGWNVMSAVAGSGDLADPPVTMAERLISPAAVNGTSPVLVKTEVGAVIRDPELERLLAEHRSHGSMSSLQMSAGFLRSATQEAPRPPSAR